MFYSSFLLQIYWEKKKTKPKKPLVLKQPSVTTFEKNASETCQASLRATSVSYTRFPPGQLSFLKKQKKKKKKPTNL